jgi:hypothetical protein
MARLSDEAWEYIQDCKEKKSIGGNARNKKVHSGRRGGMKTAADYMTQKELRAMDGEVQTYRLGSPMGWEEFSRMPDDLKKMYIKKLRDKFNVPDEALAAAIGIDIQKFAECLKSIKLSRLSCTDRSWYDTDNNGRFQTWWVVSKEEK